MARTPYRELTPTQQRMAMRRGIILASLTAILAVTLLLAIVSAIPRPIDRSRPGEWTGEAMVETARSMRRPTLTFEDVDARANTAEIPVVQDRRAVNE